MVIEHFRDGTPDRVYDRFHARGRMLPPGLVYVDSWLSAAGDTCWQIMETDDPANFDSWTAAWQDLTAFDIIELTDKPQRDPRP